MFSLLKFLFWTFVLLVVIALVAGNAHAQPPTYLPWPAGIGHTVIQGNNGSYSHNTDYTRYGWDFDLANGSAVLASAPGTVRSAVSGCANSYSSCNYGYGNSVQVCYGDGTCSRYEHLSSLAVSPGQPVAQAQLVGYSGSSGYSSGPHLHYQLENTSGISLASSFVEAGVPGQGAWVVSQNRPAAPVPQFDDIHVYAGSTLDVTAGDQVKAVVSAHYAGPNPIPCGNVNLGVRGDGPAKFGDYRADWWRSPSRVAIAGCTGNLNPGDRAEWDIYFRPGIGTADGTYRTAVWAPVNEGVAWSSVDIPIDLRVRARYQAAYAGQTVTPLVAPGSSGQLSFALKNTGVNTWQRGEVFLGTRGDAAFPFADAGWGANRNRVSLRESAVAPGGTGHFEGTFAVPAGAAPARVKQYFAPVLEGQAWFGEDIGIYAMFFAGDADHLPFTADDYGATWLSQTYVDHAMQAGDTDTVKVTLKNTGDATLFKGGQHPVDFRGIKPRDRTSGFIDPAAPNVAGNAQGVRLDQDRVAPGETFSFTLPVKVADWVAPGDYPEYFQPVAEGTTWFGSDGIWWKFTVQ